MKITSKIPVIPSRFFSLFFSCACSPFFGRMDIKNKFPYSACHSKHLSLYIKNPGIHPYPFPPFFRYYIRLSFVSSFLFSVLFLSVVHFPSSMDWTFLISFINLPLVSIFQYSYCVLLLYFTSAKNGSRQYYHSGMCPIREKSDSYFESTYGLRTPPV